MIACGFLFWLIFLLSSPSSRALALSQKVSCSPVDTQQCLEKFLIVTTSEGGSHWQLVNRGQ